MRIAYKGNIFTTNNDIFFGLNLGSDYTAEHEHGIKGIQQSFGINNDPITLEMYGIKKRTITIVPEKDLIFKDITIEGIKYSLLLFNPYIDEDFKVTKRVLYHYELNPYRKDEPELYAAWDNKSFGILVPKEKHFKELKELYQAILNKDCAITIYSNSQSKNPYDTNPGLSLFIISKMPKELQEEIAEKDLDKYKLHECATKTGIEEILRTAGKHYFALSPVWANEEKTEVKFWLNPMKQNEYNYGYFTVEELRAWAEDKGPIIK